MRAYPIELPDECQNLIPKLNDTPTLKGTKERNLVRALHLVSLLLEAPRKRQTLLVELGEALVNVGLSSAMPSLADGKDGLSSLARDVASLKELRFLRIPAGKTYRATPGPALPLWATPAEAQALAVARMALDQLGLPEVAELDALLARVPIGVRRAAERRAVNLAPSMRVADEIIWETLQRGIASGRCLRLVYQKPHGAPLETVIVDRAQIVWLTGAYYLVAYVPDRAVQHPDLPGWRHVREYRLDRIRVAEVLQSPVTLLQLPALRCIVLLDGELRERVFDLYDTNGLPIQAVQPLPDGSVRMVFEDVSLLRARQRVMSFGEHLLAIEEPAELRDAIGAMAATLGARFCPPNSKGSLTNDNRVQTKSLAYDLMSL